MQEAKIQKVEKAISSSLTSLSLATDFPSQNGIKQVKFVLIILPITIPLTISREAVGSPPVTLTTISPVLLSHPATGVPLPHETNQFKSAPILAPPPFSSPLMSSKEPSLPHSPPPGAHPLDRLLPPLSVPPGPENDMQALLRLHQASGSSRPACLGRLQSRGLGDEVVRWEDVVGAGMRRRELCKAAGARLVGDSGRATTVSAGLIWLG